VTAHTPRARGAPSGGRAGLYIRDGGVAADHPDETINRFLINQSIQNHFYFIHFILFYYISLDQSINCSLL